MVVLALSLFAAPASAEEPAAPVDCATLEGDAKTECEKKQSEAAMAEAKAKLEALGDCTAKEGEAKATCEKEKAELEAKLAAAPEAPAEGKGGKAQRSNTNRMEADVTEE